MEIFSADLNSQFKVLVQVAVAMALGGVVGLEREMSGKPAGFRTHMIVAGAAALFIGLADALALVFSSKPYAHALRIEPIRIIGAIITGISFLGAGTIFRDEEGVIEGLTTAASILFVSGIGIAVGLKQYVVAVSVTALILIVLIAMKLLEGFFERMRR